MAEAERAKQGNVVFQELEIGGGDHQLNRQLQANGVVVCACDGTLRKVHGCLLDTKNPELIQFVSGTGEIGARKECGRNALKRLQKSAEAGRLLWGEEV